ncbi:hypothetical protein HWI79_2045 [Cryptosporidium felis]|nr:hypothetical protein HWI79_2045 [Cryptosporidium felis]
MYLLQWNFFKKHGFWVDRAHEFIEKLIDFRCKSVILPVIFILGTFLMRVSGEGEPLLNIEELNKHVHFTEDFYHKHVPEAVRGVLEKEGLNEVEGTDDVSLVSTDENFEPDLEAKAITREMAHKEFIEQKKKGNVNLPEEELSFIEEKESDDSLGGDSIRFESLENDPGANEQKEILKYDTEKKKKLLRMRRKNKFRDISFGPQASHLAMADIFGITGDEASNPLMEIYGLESKYDIELNDFEEAHSSVARPSGFTEKKIWGYDGEGKPIYSRKAWMEQKLGGTVVSDEVCGSTKRRIEYLFPQKFYMADGFLDEFGTFGVKSLLDKYKYHQDFKYKEKRKKKPVKSVKSPEIVKKEIVNNSKVTIGREKRVGWQVAHRMIDMESRDKIAKDFEDVGDLSEVISVMRAIDPDKQRKDAEKVFWEYYSKKKDREYQRKKEIFDIELAIPSTSSETSEKPKKTLMGWREVLFDQAVDNIGKYDPRASQRFDVLLGGDELKGIPPSRIITDMSSEAIRRPKTHHMFQNPIKGFKNIFFRRLEKKYREYVVEILQLRAEDNAYNEMMDFANKYESRQDWLSQFDSPWLFIPFGLAIPEKLRSDEVQESEDKKIDEYENQLLSLELEVIPTRDIDIFMSQHLKGDVIFPDEMEAEDEKEAMFRKIIRETAGYNENQPYRLPHRPKGSKLLPVSDSYSPREAIRERDKLLSKTEIIKQGRVVANPIEKAKIKVIEKGVRKKIESGADEKERQANLKEKMAQRSDMKSKGDNFTGSGNIERNTRGSSNSEHLERAFKDEGRGPRMDNPPFSTFGVSTTRPHFSPRRKNAHKTVFSRAEEEYE